MDLHKKIPDIEIKTDYTTRVLYATDASIYRELPRGVIYPKNAEEVKSIIKECFEQRIPLISRGAGTSLAGQVVGNGFVIDFSRYMNRVLELNTREKWVWVEPGVVLDQLNEILKPHGLFFGPETSTGSRCTLGGMVGNNSCGSHSLLYKTTREHLLEVECVLADGSIAHFCPLSPEQFYQKCTSDTLEGNIYRTIKELLEDDTNREIIKNSFPEPELYRRNNGYALDLLAESKPFNPQGKYLNMCDIIAGSEGTLAIATRIKLNLVELPPQNISLICAHFSSLEEALQANLIALKFNPGAVELMDDKLLEAADRNIVQKKNRFFINGNPKAILAIELSDKDIDALNQRTHDLISDLQSKKMGYHFPVITGADIQKVWALRKAGLGVLTNIPGDAKPVTVIEDTAVAVEKLPAYIEELKQVLQNHGLSCVFHAHVGSGELHLRPVINLKTESGQKQLRAIAVDIAHLVKKYRGSLSGEHGDGRLRSELLPILFGNEAYSMLEKIKTTFDPRLILNPGKKVFPVPMDQSLRYDRNHVTPEIDTYFDFSSSQGFIRSIEMCNGSADCRRTDNRGGNMCPTFMATREESYSTRARANILREILTRSSQKNPFNTRELYEILDKCIACKACKSECPSNIDMAKFKSEFLQHYHKAHGADLRTRFFMHIDKVFALAMLLPGLTQKIITHEGTSRLVKKLLRLAPQRQLPSIAKKSFRAMIKNSEISQPQNDVKTVYLFIDEFTNYTEPHIGLSAIRFLTKLGYHVKTVKNPVSGRTYLSKGNLKLARKLAKKQVELFHPLISEATPLLGIEPSAILSFRDEYPDLLKGTTQLKARELAKNCLLIDEFIVEEFTKGNIRRNQFTENEQFIKLHVHCQQKAIATSKATIEMLQIPRNYRVEEIKSSCCGMGGAFGYEKEHFELSMKMGELVLFPAVRQTPDTTIIAANGTSCRQQILDGTGRKAYHPIEILSEAII